jgi:hypothetical protein
MADNNRIKILTAAIIILCSTNFFFVMLLLEASKMNICLTIVGIALMQMVWELQKQAKHSANCCETFPEKRCETL